MNILAIRFARLGDVVLLLPALDALKRSFPESHLTFLTGHRCAPMAELCPAIDEVISIDRIAMRDGPPWKAAAAMLGLLKDIRRRKFDLVVDFHGFRETNLLAWFSGAPVRVAMKRYRAPYWGFCFNRPPILEDKSMHVGDMFHKVVEGVAGRELARGSPGLNDARSTRRHEGPHVTMYVDAPVPERIWPPESFARAADFIIDKLHAKVTVVCGKENAAVADRVLAASRHVNEIAARTDLTIPELVDLIASSRLLVSNDTGPMHIGPAVGVPTLGLFSVGLPEHFRPAGPDGRFLRANPIQRIEVKDVIGAVEEMWARAADRDLRR